MLVQMVLLLSLWGVLGRRVAIGPALARSLSSVNAHRSLYSTSQQGQGSKTRLFSSYSSSNPQDHKTNILIAFSSSSSSTLSIRDIETPEQLEAIGANFADILLPGDVVMLRGDLGAGKTTFSRGIIKRKLGDNEMLVTSPSYLLDNTYHYYHRDPRDPNEKGENEDDKPRSTRIPTPTPTPSVIHHIDLYRLPKGFNPVLLDMPAIFASCLCLVEWPERLSSVYHPPVYVDVDMRIDPVDERRHITARVLGLGLGLGEEEEEKGASAPGSGRHNHTLQQRLMSLSRGN